MPTTDFENPWQTLTIREVYDNPWINVTHREVLNPSGNPGIYGLVHLKNIAIGILPLDKENNTWLVGQYRYHFSGIAGKYPKAAALWTNNP